MRLPSGTLSSKQGISKRVIIGFTALASAAVVSTIGMAGAMSNPDNKPPESFCKKFQNHGQCVKAWKNPKFGYGYPGGGGGHHHNIHNNSNVGIKVDGNNNNVFVDVAVNVYNYIFN